MLLLIAAAFLAGFVAAPPFYALVAFHGDWIRVVKAPILLHIALIATANVIVMLSAIPLTGPFDRKLAAVFTRALVVHGLVALTILVTRQWYSIPILLAGVAVSIVAGCIFAFVRQRSVPARIGVIGPRHAIMDDPNLHCAPIAAPSEPIGRFDLIVITSADEAPASWAPTLTRALLAGKRVRHVSEFLEEVQGSVAIEHFDLDQLPVGGLTSYRTRKRLFDLACVAAAVPVALPLVALASLGVLVTMGRPVLFVQWREGMGGRAFRMFKLRTMRHARPDDGLAATGPNDARVTSFGRILRRFRIDELPQLWNVLTGDMSFIGPRPEWVPLAETFAAQEPAYHFRNLVRPGITGWAQVRTGPAADLAETRVKLGYDLFYLKHLSFSLDLQILIRTLWTLAAGGGAR
jgi:lipopolysaccharide/colanic/teichoic acid biosynthesis glycosyltransferase